MIVKLKSKSGKDVRKCHLRQDVVDWWTKRENGTISLNEDKLIENDYHLGDYARGKFEYGGWWFLDQPEWGLQTPANFDERMLPLIYTLWFFQIYVFVEENPDVKIYWGGYANADFSKEGADENAIVERDHYTNETRKENPYAK